MMYMYMYKCVCVVSWLTGGLSTSSPSPFTTHRSPPANATIPAVPMACVPIVHAPTDQNTRRTMRQVMPCQRVQLWSRENAEYSHNITVTIVCMYVAAAEKSNNNYNGHFTTLIFEVDCWSKGR